MLRRFALASIVLAAAAPAWAGDRSDCRKARREMSVDGWTRYVMGQPYGRCQDEALGQLIVLTVGRLAGQMSGDPTKMALQLAQIAHSSPEDLQAMTSMFGGLGSLGGLGGLGGGYGLGSSGLSGYGEGSTDEYADYGALLGALSDEGIYGGDGSGLGTLSGVMGVEPRQIYVSYYADKVDGGWNEGDFWDALDRTRPALESCWQGLGTSPMGVYYVARFEIAGGKLTVRGLEQTYSDDGSTHADIEGCVRSSLETATFPGDYSGSYAYRVELY